MKVQNRLHRKKNQISDFSDNYFSSYDQFCSKNCQFSMNFHDNSRNKNRKIVFSFVSAHCATFMKVGSKLRGGGLHILSWDRPTPGIAIFLYVEEFFRLRCCRLAALFACDAILTSSGSSGSRELLVGISGSG